MPDVYSYLTGIILFYVCVYMFMSTPDICVCIPALPLLHAYVCARAFVYVCARAYARVCIRAFVSVCLCVPLRVHVRLRPHPRARF